MQIAPQPILPDVEGLKGAWPIWAKRAIARMLHILLPTVPMREWMSTFNPDNPIEAILVKLEDGAIWGRLIRYLAEGRETSRNSRGCAG